MKSPSLRQAWTFAIALAAAAGCAQNNLPTNAPPIATTAKKGELVSEPLEYRDVPISREAGERYFTETGVGDPYGAGIPYPMFLALLKAYPAAMGGDVAGFAKMFGLVARPDGDKSPLPTGFHLTRDPLTGVSMVMMSCALCHADRLRIGDSDRFVLGIGNRHIRIHAYERALLRLASDPRVDRSNLLTLADSLAEEQHEAWPRDIGERMVDAVLAEWRRRAAARLPIVENLGEGLPGRVATIESFTLAMNAHMGLALPLPSTTGWTRIPDVRSFRYKDSLSYDGVGIGSPITLVAEADFAFGARPVWYESHLHIGTSLYLFLRHFERDLPFPKPVDAALAEKGHTAFTAACARCHGVYGKSGGKTTLAYEESIIPTSSLGTDPARADAVTDAFVDAANGAQLTRGLVLTRKTKGYVPPPLVDVWARGPYGHDGQWPTLAVLSQKPAQRPHRFVVNPDAAYDLDSVGTAWSEKGAPSGPSSYVFDASLPGSSVEGHPYLSDLGPDAARAVIEYLKTL